jgi:hypothetical protein
MYFAQCLEVWKACIVHPLSKSMDPAFPQCRENNSLLWTYDLYGPVYVMLLIRANPLRRHVGRGWALENENFLGPKKVEKSRAKPPHTCQSNGFAFITRFTYRTVSIRGP